MSTTALMTVTSPAAVGELGTILGIWAHPDDEVYLSGGLMALATDLGAHVDCATATRGELGTADPVAWPPHRLADERDRELADSLAVVGVTDHHWLGFRDGRCSWAPAALAVDRISDLIDQVAPDTVLTFGADGVTGHADHRTVGAWAVAAFDRAAQSGARLFCAAYPRRRTRRWGALNDQLRAYEPGYPVEFPDRALAIDLTLPPDVAARKVRALAAQRTQTAGLIATMGLEEFTAWVGEETFVEAR